MATRILAHLRLLAPGGRVGMLVGSEVVYLMARTATAPTMTPYDVAAVRMDGLALAGDPPDDVTRYLAALRPLGLERAVADTIGGVVTASDVVVLVERVTHLTWAEAEAQARAAGALVGAFATES
ncbi:MAG: hypothetical protein HYX56_02750 [Chloroflexi bacterium]|nr:hypothetical protein [Chloroflexota bacterium]